MSPPPTTFRIGTIGFSYPDWKPAFYPAATPQSAFLATYSHSFDTLELDTTFHAIPPPDRVQKWAAATPANFHFCPKTPKQITHDAPLALAVPVMREFLRSLFPMHNANKLGPILIQFPPTLTVAEFDNVERFLKDLPPAYRFAIEFRNHTWQTAATAQLLTQYHCALVAADYAPATGAPANPYPLQITTDFLYLRFLGVHQQFSPLDHERFDMSPRLAWWLDQLQIALQNSPVRPTTTYSLFNNDFSGHAPATANRLRQLVGLNVHKPPAPPASPQQSLF